MSIVNEGKASEKAHKLGLKHAGYGYWADKSGNTVAKTVNDKLVSIGKIKKPKKAVAKKSKVVTKKKPKDVFAAPVKKGRKPNKTSREIILQYRDGLVQKAMAQIEANRKKGHVDFLDLKSRIKYETSRIDRNIKKLLQHEVPGETVTFIPPAKTGYLRADILWNSFKGRRQVITQNKKLYDQTARDQSGWRSGLGRIEFINLNDVQNDWQRGVNGKKYRKETNKKINTLTQGMPPIKCKFLERGMSVESKNLKSFLANFKKKSIVRMPPSGFSADPETARSFADTDAYSNAVPVLIRILPNEKGEVHALNLGSKAAAVKSLWKDFKKKNMKASPKPTGKLSKLMQNLYDDPYDDSDWGDSSMGDSYISHQEKLDRLMDDFELEYSAHPEYGLDDYEYERECIIPGWANFEVLKIDKRIAHIEEKYSDPVITMGYEIVLRATSRKSIKKAKTWNEAAEPGNRELLLQRALLFKYMNSPVNFNKLKDAAKKLLTKYVGGPVSTTREK